MRLPRIIKKEADTFKKNFGFKKVFCEDGNEVVLFLKLKHNDCKTKPTETSYGVASSVTVLGVYDMWGYLTGLKKAKSYHDKTFEYEVGKTYSPKNGIWFWGTFHQAQAYWLNAGEYKNDVYAQLVQERNK